MVASQAKVARCFDPKESSGSFLRQRNVQLHTRNIVAALTLQGTMIRPVMLEGLRKVVL